ncbi:MAG: SOS mutagenesis and repair protein UmuC [Acidobacteria bacterium]|nr:MAG: SOS mutagenesis and repair protein UmuC [Acidobacteriota bacterium]
MAQAIAIVNANEFYVSCERVFDPGLLGRPVVVLSNNDGCIISRSREARALNLTMGAPLFKVQDIVEANDVAVFSSNYQLYGDLSLRLVEAFYEFTPDVEVYSIDEAFLGLETHPDQSFRDYGLEIKAKVYQWTGVPCSLGISQTKTLSKVAQRFTKKHAAAQGVLDLTDQADQTSVLEETPVEDVWGVGPAYGKLLAGAGITTARQLRDADRRWVRRRMIVVGARIVEELRGISCLPLERCPQARKSVTCSRSFGVLVEFIEELREAVAVYTTKAAERRRRARLAAGVVRIFVSTNRFSADPQYSNSVTFELAYATDSTEELLAWTRKALERIYRPGYRYKKAGVMLNHLTPADELTTRLFGDERFERSRRLMKAVDEINRKFGRDTVRFDAVRPGGRWETKCLRRSRRYTTCLNEVLRIA